ATSPTGLTKGVYGRSESDFGRGVVGEATSITGTTFGVLGVAVSPDGYDFYADGAGVDYGAPSSIRWKRNIEPIHDPLGMVEQIRGVYFDWDEDHGGQHAIGFIGEEVGQVLPEVVAYEPNSEYVSGMDYAKLTPLLVEAVKALRAENEALRERLDQLEARTPAP
ncbi:MAG: tail fiber domain-containing protein, partial [Phycisphaerales bacterium]|nr:tail fiber domain-containing protein [Phycisphaerales bacterium]